MRGGSAVIYAVPGEWVRGALTGVCVVVVEQQVRAYVSYAVDCGVGWGIMGCAAGEQGPGVWVKPLPM